MCVGVCVCRSRSRGITLVDNAGERGWNGATRTDHRGGRGGVERKNVREKSGSDRR